MTYLIGIGNGLRGEDAFGCDVVDTLQDKALHTKKVLQLTPELCLELLEAKTIIFVDASYSINDCYKLACALPHSENSLTHSLTPHLLMQMIASLYGKSPKYCIFSMLTCHFDSISDREKYFAAVEKTVQSIELLLSYRR